SNIVFSVGNLTIPRHLRDIFVTEYGIADVRGKTDRDTIIEILKITDSRFQQALLKKAKENSKVPADYQIPLAFRGNLPEAVANLAKPFIKEGLFPTFPYGTELTKEELGLAKALRGLKARLTPKGFRPTGAAIGKTFRPPAAAKPYLERMQLDSPLDRKEKIIQKLVLYALAEDGVI
ncbi:MAG TPA: acetyl-CoA hydrolase/transferase C-terminal domain-containing protein, partial [bacterium]|nr:acetyl-CoA hydrolase/transferase C-terminal domain-containing protein [bacterium]